MHGAKVQSDWEPFREKEFITDTPHEAVARLLLVLSLVAGGVEDFWVLETAGLFEDRLCKELIFLQLFLPLDSLEFLRRLFIVLCRAVVPRQIMQEGAESTNLPGEYFGWDFFNF